MCPLYWLIVRITRTLASFWGFLYLMGIFISLVSYMKQSCSNWQCHIRTMIMTFLSISLGLAMLFFGLSKLSGLPWVTESLWGAAHALGLTFLSAKIRWRMAVIGEIRAGVMLVAWCKTSKKMGATIVLIITIIAAGGVHGWTIAGGATKAYIFAAIAILILVFGGGKWLLDFFCKKKCGICSSKQPTEIIEA